MIRPFDTGQHTALIERLQSLARLYPVERGSLELQQVALVPLFVDTVRAASGRFAAAGVDVRIRCEVAALAANEALLRVVVRKLLDNALGACPAGAVVELGCAWDDGRPVLAVRDDGPGVGPQHLARLSSVRRIAQLHAAELRVTTGLQGRGLGVEVRFACGPAARPERTSRWAPPAPGDQQRPPP